MIRIWSDPDLDLQHLFVCMYPPKLAKLWHSTGAPGPPTAVPRTNNSQTTASNFKRQNTVDSATIKVRALPQQQILVSTGLPEPPIIYLSGSGQAPAPSPTPTPSLKHVNFLKINFRWLLLFKFSKNQNNIFYSRVGEGARAGPKKIGSGNPDLATNYRYNLFYSSRIRLDATCPFPTYPGFRFRI